MKRSDFALILIVVGVVVLVAYSVANSLFGQVALQPTNVPKAELVSSSLVQPDSAVFNKDAINPAVAITIGDQSDQQPFTISD